MLERDLKVKTLLSQLRVAKCLFTCVLIWRDLIALKTNSFLRRPQCLKIIALMAAIKVSCSSCLPRGAWPFGQVAIFSARFLAQSPLLPFYNMSQ